MTETFVLGSRYLLIISFLVALYVSLNSSNAQTSSIIAPKAKDALLLDSVKLKNGKVFVVGDRGHILSFDSNEAYDSRQWKQAVVPTNHLLTSVYFANDALGWAVGHDSAVLVTKDGGQSWLTQFLSPEREQPLFDVMFMDESRGFAIGAYGLFLKTRDGGNTWSDEYIQALDLPDYGLPHFYAITQFSGKILLMVGEAGLVARSIDGGDTWLKIDAPYDGSLFNTCVTKRNAVVAFGLRGNIIRSEDAGVTWELIDSPTANALTRCRVFPNGKMMITGMDGIILISDDDGLTYSKVQHKDRKDYAGLLELDNENIMLIGEGGSKQVNMKGEVSEKNTND